MTADNYEAAVSLLNRFAVAGSVGAVEEQKLERGTRRPKSGRQSKPQLVFHTNSLSSCSQIAETMRLSSAVARP